MEWKRLEESGETYGQTIEKQFANSRNVEFKVPGGETEDVHIRHFWTVIYTLDCSVKGHVVFI